MNVLIVDDDAELARTLAALLERRSHTVATLTRGSEALTLAKDASFEIVILDVHMPDMNGFDVLRGLRAQGYGGAVIMLTGQSDVEDAVQAMRLGADDYLPKPVRIAALDRALAAAVASSRRSPPRP